MKLELTVNGERRSAEVAPLRRLLDVLREDLRLTGTKEGCGEGECGACSVILDGQVVDSCLIPACQVGGSEVLTIEGLGDAAHLHPLQDLFVIEGGTQCGICTPGMLLAAKGLLDADPDPDDHAIRVAIAGNLCRCTGYEKIVKAVREAAKVMREGA
jgi:aerobic-type carbon monoxide dehydrogenase small subunit (CoxS/CutS family)